ncbi:MaoC family dehydratase [Sphingomonas morindae]|uniref:MaoC family dehydratase n=1 Tax=Sphingomonas morindae TaxID=1541170 RepID=A0ABY4X5V2_9SPHN|nr:MaoC family dehydratase [Sphingomonas morindae]USI72259.1 MaoC family dehydratase [Sphingomonas morindae]
MPYWQDFSVGQRLSFGRYVVTREEVIEFARRFDPQPFHLDDDAAARTHFGRLAASGWHSCAMAMAMIVAEHERMDAIGSLGSPGIERLRWLKPVYPGDVLRCESEVLEVRGSRSRPEMGAVRSRLTVLNQHDEPVLEQEPTVFYRSRPA